MIQLVRTEIPFSVGTETLNYQKKMLLGAGILFQVLLSKPVSVEVWMIIVLIFFTQFHTWKK